MEPSVSSPRQGVLSLDCVSDPKEQDFSEEDDDDRNHKHRRQETRSQSLERDDSEQVFTRPYRKNNRHFENGYSLREHDKRHGGAASVQRVPFDSNQRIRTGQMFSGDSGPGRGRGRDYGSWNPHDSRFSNLDLSSQILQVGSMVPNIFGGTALSGVSTAQNARWPGFGMLPGVPNGGLNALHSIGLQGNLRPAINSSMNVGISRQRCRDFEERGFCLRGDMCPMEHGINRIVVDDVQSLSQFNLPVSLPSAPLLATPSGSMSVHSVGASSIFMNSKGGNGKNSKPGTTGDGVGSGVAYPGAGGTDFYDPDQPLWNSNTTETSAAIAALNSRNIGETEPVLDDDRHDGAGNESAAGSSRGDCQSRANAKDRRYRTLNSSGFAVTQPNEALTSARHGKKTLAGDTSQENLTNIQSDAMHNMRKPSQKAFRTLFVNGIPRENNKKELLLGHFLKFGKVIDIYIPSNSERAFIQFSKREEAEAALKAPDAVMGNRFIKLWWANRDTIPDNGVASTPRGGGTVSASNQFPVAATSKDNLQPAAPKTHVIHTSEVKSSSDRPNPAVTNHPKVPPPQKKKSEALEQLKVELRKKQEMLEQKRNEFRERLAQLEKQASGVQGEEATEQAAKRLKVGVAADLSEVPLSRSPDSNAAKILPHVEAPTHKSILVQNVSNSPKSKTESPLQGPKTLKQPSRPIQITSPSIVNRYKLDNRPTAFRVIPPLPTGLADVAVLKEHFSSHGNVSNVELEDDDSSDNVSDSDKSKGCAARITFTTRCAAEKAFANGKCWQGHNLQFAWVTRNNNPGNVHSGKESSAFRNVPSEGENTPVFNVSSGKESSSVPNALGDKEDSSVSNVKELSDITEGQTVEKSAGIQNTVSEDDVSENLEKKQRNESSELHGVSSQSSEAMETGEEDSHTDAVDVC